MWLIEKKALEKLQKFYDSDIKLSDEQLTAFSEIESSDSRIRTVDDDVAHINVTGVLTNKPDFLAWLFGGGNTTYTEINSALAAAENSKKISSVQMNIDSPGASAALMAMPRSATCSKILLSITRISPKAWASGPKGR